jgi:putative component of toxin-antitoxin plasmid stabilization module
MGQVIEFIIKKQGRSVVILLAGGDKRTQSRNIKTALRLARNL